MTETSSMLVLADTNVVVYAYEKSDPVKHVVARELLQKLLTERRLLLSVQTLNEFYVAVTRPTRAVRLDRQEAIGILTSLSRVCPVAPLTRDATFLALDAVGEHGLSFWDALIWAVAKENSVPVIYTEDFQHGREIEGVRFENPFVSNPA